MRRAASAMSRSGWVMPRASHRAITSAITAAMPPASRNCHHTLCRNPKVAEMRPSDPLVGEGYSTIRLPPSSVGIDAQTLLPITPHRGTRPGVSGGSTPRFTPSTVTSPVTVRRTTIVSGGGSATSPAAMRRASARASMASESRGELRSAKPISA